MPFESDLDEFRSWFKDALLEPSTGVPRESHKLEGTSNLAYFLKASVTDCAVTSNCGQSSSSWSKGAVILVTVVERWS